MEINIPEVVTEMLVAFQSYETALVTNDVAQLDLLFWEDTNVVRYGVTENLYGAVEILAFRNARPSSGLGRTLHRTVITTFGYEFATANCEFTKKISSRIGRQSQTWAKLDGSGTITSAHVSWMET
tara:strand:- start:1211 stop:1588 length:378 start_codon:yes stop_codon:yes gene_type:complete